MILYNNFFNNINLTINNFGYSNNNLVINWLRYIEKYDIKQQIKLYYFLIIDSYGLYLIYKFLFFAKKHKIILFYLLFLFYTFHLTIKNKLFLTN